MRYKLFGNTGLRVSELSLGTMTFGKGWGWGSSPDESRRVFDAYVEAGGNFFDTANMYTGGDSEKILGEFIAANRDQYVIATKCTLTMNPADPNAGGNHRKNLTSAVNASLTRLDTDYIDILWLHSWDFLTPVEETMRVLDDLVRSGKIQYVGVSNVPAWYLAKANMLAELRGWTAFAGIQINYSLIERSSEREMLLYVDSHGLLTTAWSPLGGGMLTGKYGTGTDRREPEGMRHSEEGPFRDFSLTDRNFEIAGTVKAVADELGCSMAQVALAWLLHKNDNIVPIIGAREVRQLEDNLASVKISLSADQMQRLSDVSAPVPEYPGAFWAAVGPASLYGETLDKIDFRDRPY